MYQILLILLLAKLRFSPFKRETLSLIQFNTRGSFSFFKGEGYYLIFKSLRIQSILTLHTQNNMTIKKISSIAKLEDLGRIKVH